MPNSNIYRRLLASLLLSGAATAFLQAAAPIAIVRPGNDGFIQRAGQMTAFGNTAGTIDQLNRILADPQSLDEAERSAALLEIGRALYMRGDAACLKALEAFASEFPSATEALQARLMMADFLFFTGEYGPASQAYANARYSGLAPDERNKYTYRRALSLCRVGEFKEADRLFASITGDATYGTAAEFYRAYIDYARGNLDNALRRFDKVEGRLAVEKEKGNGLPSAPDAATYIAQIEFQKGRYDEAARDAENCLKAGAPEEFVPELNRILGESLFQLNRYKDARNPLQRYINASESPLPSAVYDLGVILYDHKDFTAAQDLFSRISDEASPLGQGANLYLGQIAAAEGNPSSAALYFEKSYREKYDDSITESALYNYVAARADGGRIPFGSSIELLEEFLNRFPHSKYAPAVEESRAAAYFNEKNYYSALAALEKIPNPSRQVLAVKQKTLYELGAEAMANDNFKAAQEYMSRAAAMQSIDAEIARQSRLWLADAFYRDKQYKKASEQYNLFLSSAPASSNKTLGYYDLGYSLYMADNYKDALEAFRKALASKPALPSALKADATVREADCLYSTGRYKEAIAGYDAAAKSGVNDPDYVAMRRAVAVGLNGDTAGKISGLQNMISSYPDSKWLAAAMLELGRTQGDAGNLQQAAATFDRLLELRPESAEARIGRLSLAVMQNDAGKRSDAIATYRSVIEMWSTSQEAVSANDDLKRLYAEAGELDKYLDFINSVPGAPRPDNDELEKLTFDSAEDAWADNPAATARLKQYLEKYPQGKYVARALIDIAKSEESAGRFAEALSCAEDLLKSRPDSPQAVEALLMKANICESKFSGRREEALKAWRELERRASADLAPSAWAGIMRLTPDASERLSYAKRLEGVSGNTPDRAAEICYYKSSALYALGRNEEAKKAAAPLEGDFSTVYGARAAVEAGERLLKEKNYKEAERILLGFTDEGTPHAYWLARGYIALADTYKASGKKQVALDYIRSLKENYPGSEDDIRIMIEERLKTW